MPTRRKSAQNPPKGAKGKEDTTETLPEDAAAPEPAAEKPKAKEEQPAIAHKPTLIT